MSVVTDTRRGLEATGAELAGLLAEAETLSGRGGELERGGDPEGAVACYDRALALLAGRGRHPLMASLLYQAGVVRTRLGRTTEAESLFHESLEVATWCDDREGQAYAVNCLAVIAQRRGELGMATALYRRAGRLATETSAHRLTGMIEQNLGVVANIRGDLDSALVHYRQSRQAFEEADDVEGLSWVLNNLGMLESDLGQYSTAVATLAQAKTLAHARGDVITEGLIELNRAEALIGLGQHRTAREAAGHARDLASKRGDRLQTAEALKHLGTLDRLDGLTAQAADRLETALRLAEQGEDELLVAELIRELGVCWHDRGDVARTRAHWQAALERFVDLDAVLDAKDLRERLHGLDSLNAPDPHATAEAAR